MGHLLDGPQECESPPVFGQVQTSRGPFASYAEFSSFFNERARMAYKRKNLPEDHPWRKEQFDDSETLVLTHQDINPRNIIVGKDGRLWLVDFGWAGYYPPWFEYIGMLCQEEIETKRGAKHKYWRVFIPFICSPYFKQEMWLRNMASAFNWLI